MGKMVRNKSLVNALVAALVLPLVLAGCGGAKPPKPCRESAKSMMGDDMAMAKNKATRYIRNETHLLTNKFPGKITFKPAVQTCTEGIPLPADFNALSKKEQKTAKRKSKPFCDVRRPMTPYTGTSGRTGRPTSC